MNRKGFTLVELLIGILILSIVVLTLFSSFDAFVSSSRAVNSDILRTREIRQALEIMSADLESLFMVQPPRYKKPGFDSDPDPFRFLVAQKDVGSQNFSEMEFSCVGRSIEQSSVKKGVAKIKYLVKENTLGEFNLYRAEQLHPVETDVDTCNAALLCRNITGFEIHLADDNGEDQDTWDSDAKENRFSIPALAELMVTIHHNNQDQIYKTAIILPSSRRAIK